MKTGVKFGPDFLSVASGGPKRRNNERNPEIVEYQIFF